MNNKKLPPIGVTCKIAEKTQYFTHDKPVGHEVKMYAHFTDDRWTEMAAYVCDKGKVGGVGVARLFEYDDERSLAIKEMMSFGSVDPEEFCGSLYDNGWRKKD